MLLFVASRSVGIMVTTSLILISVREVCGSIPGPVKSDTVSPPQRVSSEFEAVSPKCIIAKMSPTTRDTL